MAGASAEEREALDRQWRRREEGWRLALERARRGAGGGTDDGDEMRSAAGGVLAEVEELREAVNRLSRDKERLLDRLPLSGSSSEVTEDASAAGGSGERCSLGKGDMRQRGRSRGADGDGESDQGDEGTVDGREDEEGRGARGVARSSGTEAEKRHDQRGGNVDEWPPSGERLRDEDEGRRRTDEEEEELLMPRGGPVPTPSRFTPRSGAAGLGSGGGGSGGWIAARSAGKSVAAVALLRSVLRA